MAGLLAGAVAASVAFAQDDPTTEGLKLRAVVTAGTWVRTSSPRPELYGRLPSTVPDSVPAGQLVGHTGGADLNFRRGDPFSTVVKALLSAELGSTAAGAVARLSVWHDATLAGHGVPYGNFPSRYAPGRPLEDTGFERSARFTGAQWREVSAHGQWDRQGLRLSARAGRLLLGLGTATLLPQGLGAMANPLDLPAQQRPGAQPEEERVPLGSLDLRVDSGPWGVRMVVPWEAPRVRLPGCGTFFDVTPGLATGCALTGAVSVPLPGTPLSTLEALTERRVLDSGFYLHRGEDTRARDGGQFVLVLRRRIESVDGNVALHLLRLHSALPVLQVQVENAGGQVLPAGVAGGLQRLVRPDGLRYAALYPEDVRAVALTGEVRPHRALKVHGELIWRSRQPLAYNASDVITAFLLRSPTSLLNLQRGALGVAPGARFDAYDRFDVVQLIAGLQAGLGPVLGADAVGLWLEAGWNHVRHLPDPSVMRYGRSVAFGSAPYLLGGRLTPCTEAVPGVTGVPGRTCTTDGFVTADATGVRARVAAVYRDALAGATLTPSLALAIDLYGHSHDGAFVNGRVVARLGLRAEWPSRRFLELHYTHQGGGAYNLLADRSHAGLVAGAAF